MTITSEVTEKSYTGNDSTVAFPTTFQFFGTTTSAELVVTERTITTGAEATMTNGVDYTVSGGSGATGTVTAAVAPASTVEWHLTRNTTRQQATDYVENDPFPSASHENALDRLTMTEQEDDGRYDRTPHFRKSDTYAGGEPHLPVLADRTDKILGFDANGDFDVHDLVDLGTGSLSDANAEDLGVADPGTSLDASRVDHVHKLPTGADLSLEIGVDTQAYSADLDNVSGTNTGDEAAASTTVSGTVEIATQAEVNTGTDTTRSITPATLDAFVNGKTDTAITAADEIVFADVTDSNASKKDTVQGILDLVSSGGLTMGTAQATTSGTAFNFGSIPAGVTQIIVSFIGVSLSGTDAILVQLGDAGGIEASGYLSLGYNDQGGGGGGGTTAYTTGFGMRNQAAGDSISGQMILTLADPATFTWASSHTAKLGGTVRVLGGGGDKSLSAELTQLTITRDGANTFDAGKVNIQYI